MMIGAMTAAPLPPPAFRLGVPSFVFPAGWADNVERLDEAMVTLAESGVQTNRRIDQLGMRVDQLVSAMGAMMQRQSPPPNAG